METRFKIGEIASTHGVRGEVKVYPTTDDINRFKKLKECTLETKKEQLTVHVKSCKFFKNMAILKFEEFDSLNEVEQYKHASLYVDRDHAVKLQKDEYFIADLIGMKVFTDNTSNESEEKEFLGTLKDVLQTGANDVYIVELANPNTEQKEVLIPAIKQCILDMNVEAGEMRVHLLDGLIE